MQSEWDEATMSKVGIEYRPNAVFKWAEWIHDMGDKMGKTNAQKRAKFLAGFPEAFDVIVMPEKLAPGNGNYVFPAVYPQHDPQNGNAHPHANEPDIDAMAMAFSTPWYTMLHQGKIKKVPKGLSAKSLVMEDSTESEDESAFFTREQIDANTVCLACGGRGHVVRLGSDQCMTAKLGIKIPSAELGRTVYPNGIQYPRRNNLSESRRRTISKFQRNKAKQAARDAKQAAQDEILHGVNGTDKALKIDKRNPIKKKQAKSTTTSSSEDDEEDYTEHEASETDQQEQVKLAVAFDDMEF